MLLNLYLIKLSISKYYKKLKNNLLINIMFINY